MRLELSVGKKPLTTTISVLTRRAPTPVSGQPLAMRRAQIAGPLSEGSGIETAGHGSRQFHLGEAPKLRRMSGMLVIAVPERLHQPMHPAEAVAYLDTNAVVEDASAS